MSHGQKKRGSHLADWKRKESEKTAEELDKALNRFESGKFTHLPKGSKLTRFNLATEAGVAKDTPFARYREGHPKAGEYRLPQVVARFNRLREKQQVKLKKRTETNKAGQLKITILELERMLAASRCVVNAQDIEIDKLKQRCRELEELTVHVTNDCDNLRAELAKFRRQGIKEVSATGRNKSGVT